MPPQSGSGGSSTTGRLARAGAHDACRHVSTRRGGGVRRGRAALLSSRRGAISSPRSSGGPSSPPSRPPSFESVACIGRFAVAVRSGASTSTSPLPAAAAAASPSAPIAARRQVAAVVEALPIAVGKSTGGTRPRRGAWHARASTARAPPAANASCASRNAAMAPSISSRALSRTDSLVGPGFSPKSPETRDCAFAARIGRGSNAAAASGRRRARVRRACARAPRPRVSLRRERRESWSAEATSAVTAAREIAADVCAAPRTPKTRARGGGAEPVAFSEIQKTFRFHRFAFGTDREGSPRSSSSAVTSCAASASAARASAWSSALTPRKSRSKSPWFKERVFGFGKRLLEATVARRAPEPGGGVAQRAMRVKPPRAPCATPQRNAWPEARSR